METYNKVEPLLEDSKLNKEVNLVFLTLFVMTYNIGGIFIGYSMSYSN